MHKNSHRKRILVIMRYYLSLRNDKENEADIIAVIHKNVEFIGT
jgi:hypothetical protein